MASEEGSRVPGALAVSAAWAWRLLVIGVVVYAAARIIAALLLVVIPVAAALLLTALLQPPTARLRNRGLPPLAATWVTILVALLVIGGIGVVVGVRASDEFPSLVAQVVHSARAARDWLVTGPLHLQQSQLQQYVTAILDQLQKQQARIANTVVAGAGIAAEVAAGAVLTFFITFFLVKDGEHIWVWFLGLLRTEAAERADRAGRVAWRTLAQYVHGTVLVAAIHAIVIGVVLLVMRVPLWAPLTVLIFVASFVPLVGILIAGTLAVLVVLGTKGWVAALVFLGILTIEQQMEGHLLQPLVVGRMVRLHPLAVIIVLAVGSIAAGIFGAIIAVPLAAMIYRAGPELRRAQVSPADPVPDTSDPPDAPPQK